MGTSSERHVVLACKTFQIGLQYKRVTLTPVNQAFTYICAAQRILTRIGCCNIQPFLQRLGQPMVNEAERVPPFPGR